MKSKVTIIILFFFIGILNTQAEKIALKENQILKNVEESVYKTVRLMLYHTESAKIIKKDDMQNLISAFGADQKITQSEKDVLDQLQGDVATFAIESPYTKSMLVINKAIEPAAANALSFFWDRLSMSGTDRDMVANYLYFHLPGRFFEYYYFNTEKNEEMISILNEYLDYVCKNSDKESWSHLREELNRINAQINIGNKIKEDEYRKLVMTCYQTTRERYDSPKIFMAMAN